MKEVPNYSPSIIGSKLSVAIIQTHWNREIVEGLTLGATKALAEGGVVPNRIWTITVPGAFEIPLAAEALLQGGDIHAIVALGCIIKGETAHFEHIAQTAINGIAQVSQKYLAPIGCGILTVYNMEQARARSRDDVSNKGREAALAALEMVGVLNHIKTSHSRS